MWFLAVALFTNCVLFFGISYFDHTKIMWFALLAIIAAATAPILASQTSDELVPEKYAKPLKPAFPVPRLARVVRETSATNKDFQASRRLRS
jgi:hypothetical protein